jgi:hypothetical protein
VWGFADSGFRVNEAGQVEFRVARYATSGKVIPNLLPWAETILGLPLDPKQRRASGYPTALPERVGNEPLERALASRLPAFVLHAEQAAVIGTGLSSADKDFRVRSYEVLDPTGVRSLCITHPDATNQQILESRSWNPSKINERRHNERPVLLAVGSHRDVNKSSTSDRR